MTEDVEAFAYLWASSSTWALLEFKGSGDPPAIFDQATSRVLMIEDDDLYAKVVQRMKDAGAPVIVAKE